VISIHDAKMFAFKVTFKTIHTAVERQVIPDLWSNKIFHTVHNESLDNINIPQYFGACG